MYALTTRNKTNAVITNENTAFRKLPIRISLSPIGMVIEEKSGCPKIAAMIGVKTSATSDWMTTLNASLGSRQPPARPGSPLR